MAWAIDPLIYTTTGRNHPGVALVRHVLGPQLWDNVLHEYESYYATENIEARGIPWLPGHRIDPTAYNNLIFPSDTDIPLTEAYTNFISTIRAANIHRSMARQPSLSPPSSSSSQPTYSWLQVTVIRDALDLSIPNIRNDVRRVHNQHFGPNAYETLTALYNAEFHRLPTSERISEHLIKKYSSTPRNATPSTNSFKILHRTNKSISDCFTNLPNSAGSTIITSKEDTRRTKKRNLPHKKKNKQTHCTRLVLFRIPLLQLIRQHQYNRKLLPQVPACPPSLDTPRHSSR